MTSTSLFLPRGIGKSIGVFLVVIVRNTAGPGIYGATSYGNPEFRQSVVASLSYLADNPELRSDTFMVSVGATASCEDRVSSTYNDMKKARLAFDVAHGMYDDNIPALIGVAKGMFCLDMLDRISQDKVKSLRFVDQIEVNLAFQTKLRDRLNLPLDVTDMRYFDVSYVTEADLQAAESAVNGALEKDFLAYLSTDWKPWQSVLQRMYEEEYEATGDRLVEAMGNEFSNRLGERMKNLGLSEDDDASRILGAQVKDEIAHEINGQLAMNFLNSRGLSHLLHS